MNGIRLKHLAFLSPLKAPAVINFGDGLNVIYGASDTGKSFIVNAIDFMTGGGGPLPDIPERVGYNAATLGIQFGDGSECTLWRSVDGGRFRLFDGLHETAVPADGGVELADQHNETRSDNVSAFLLSKIELDHKKVRKNKAGDTRNLTFRYLARLIIVDEEEIIQKRSPLSDGNPTQDTSNLAVFKLLLTGVDDSTLSAAIAKNPEQQTRGAQLDLLDQLIADLRSQVRELAGPPAELEDQLGRIEYTIGEQGILLNSSEGEYREVANRRREIILRVEEGRNRLTEITALLERFTLLNAHYISDIERLRGIEEAGSLFSALGSATCPLCGAAPEHHSTGADCEADVETIISAARSEIKKIDLRQAELKNTIASLRTEAVALERRMPALEIRLSEAAGRIEQIVAPTVRRLRASYGALADKRTEVREALGLYRQLRDLEERKRLLETEESSAGGGNVNDAQLSTTTLDKFSTLVLEILKKWHFPSVSRVHFDIAARDLVIDGKRRTSYGKGLRAITQAAFTIGLLEYCRENATPHPGFAIMDSPLLSYREPDSDDDDLRGTDLNSCFYSYLRNMASGRQIIVIENTDPPSEVKSLEQSIEFTRRPDVGRYGFFPIQEREASAAD